MTEDEVKSIALAGEGLEVEFKEALSGKDDKALGKEIAAFSTTAGGTLLIGIKDDGSIVGVKDAKSLCGRIERWCADLISPPPVVNIEVVSVGCNDVVVVRVADGVAPLYLFDGRPYARVGTSSVRLNVAQIVDLVRGRRIEDVIASMESSLSVAQSTALAAMNAIAPAVAGQSELATMSYNELRERVFSELRASAAFAALESGLAVAQSTASMALASPVLGDLAHSDYGTVISRILSDIEHAPSIQMLHSITMMLQSSIYNDKALVDSLSSRADVLFDSLEQVHSKTNATSNDLREVQLKLAVLASKVDLIDSSLQTAEPRAKS